MFNLHIMLSTAHKIEKKIKCKLIFNNFKTPFTVTFKGYIKCLYLKFISSTLKHTNVQRIITTNQLTGLDVPSVVIFSRDSERFRDNSYLKCLLSRGFLFGNKIITVTRLEKDIFQVDFFSV